MSRRDGLRSSAGLLGLFIGSLAVTGCPPPGDRSEVGELGNGTFTYACVGNTDDTCGLSEISVPFVVAVGGRFNAKFATNGGAAKTVSIPTTTSVEKLDTGYRVLAPGLIPMLAVDGNGEVIDFRHVRGKRAAKVRVEGSDGIATSVVQLAPGASTLLRAEAVDDEDVRLRGALDFTWRASNDTLLVTPPDVGGSVRVTALHSGPSSLTITLAGDEFTIPVNPGLGDTNGPPDSGSTTPLDGGLLDASSPASTDGGAP